MKERSSLKEGCVVEKGNWGRILRLYHDFQLFEKWLINNRLSGNTVIRGMKDGAVTIDVINSSEGRTVITDHNLTFLLTSIKIADITIILDELKKVILLYILPLFLLRSSQ
jgi:hypothetical protein